jgi:hypothetical protein
MWGILKGARKAIPVPRDEDDHIPTPPHKYPLPHGGLAFSVFNINNGYLLAAGGELNLRQETIYCKDLNEVHEQMVASLAKKKIDARYGAKYDPATAGYTVTLPATALAAGERISITTNTI